MRLIGGERVDSNRLADRLAQGIACRPTGVSVACSRGKHLPSTEQNIFISRARKTHTCNGMTNSARNAEKGRDTRLSKARSQYSQVLRAPILTSASHRYPFRVTISIPIEPVCTHWPRVVPDISQPDRSASMGDMSPASAQVWPLGIARSCCRATSAASSLALSTHWPSYQYRAATVWPSIVTVLDQAVRPPT